MIDKGMVILQSCMDLQKVGSHSYSETCLTSFHVGNQVTYMKVEDVTDIQEEDDPLSTALPVIKTEYEVSCMSACPDTQNCLFCLSPSVCPST
jgi:hypothetical protein